VADISEGLETQSRLSRAGIEAYRDIVKVGWEEPCIVIERRRSRLMAK